MDGAAKWWKFTNYRLGALIRCVHSLIIAQPDCKSTASLQQHVLERNFQEEEATNRLIIQVSSKHWYRLASLATTKIYSCLHKKMTNQWCRVGRCREARQALNPTGQGARRVPFDQRDFSFIKRLWHMAHYQLEA